MKQFTARCHRTSETQYKGSFKNLRFPSAPPALSTNIKAAADSRTRTACEQLIFDRPSSTSRMGFGGRGGYDDDTGGLLLKCCLHRYDDFGGEIRSEWGDFRARFSFTKRPCVLQLARSPPTSVFFCFTMPIAREAAGWRGGGNRRAYPRGLVSKNFRFPNGEIYSHRSTFRKN